MSRLEKAVWKQTEVPLAICGTINLPEITIPSLSGPLLRDEALVDDNLSPTNSIDSGRSTSTEVWPSHRYMLYGGPGFSIATLDSSTGSVGQIPVPVPLTSPSDSPYTQFSLSTVTALDIVGECQVWAGTESGSLHILELNSEHRFHGHSLTNLSDPITCIHSRPRSNSPGQQSRVDVLIGGSNGNLTILSGQTNQRRGLKNSLKSARKVLPLGGFGGSESINCMAFVTCEGVEICWCACGMSVVILRCSDWKELARFNAHSDDSPPAELVSSVAVSTLLSCEMGVWSSLSKSSAVTLWDKQKLSPKMTIVCWDSYSIAGWLQDSTAQISALSFFHPLLFAGTKGGHLMVFRTTEDKTGHRLIAGTHCSSSPIVDIHPTPFETDFPSPATPTPAVNILVICGDSSMSNGSAQLFELISSPYQSPITSPMSISGRVSVSSTASTPSSLSLKRLSVSECGSLPPLDLAGAFHNSRTLLPLRTD